MSDERKKSGRALWVVVAVVLTLAFPLSVLPVEWLVNRDLLPKAAIDYWVIIFYCTVPAVFMAVLIWLTVQVTNRRERWAKWSLATTLSMPILYLASWPPMARLCEWLDSHGLIPDAMTSVMWVVYYPAGFTANGNPPAWVKDTMIWYLGIWGGDLPTTVMLPALAVAFTVFSGWLSVRVIKRRYSTAKQT